MSVNDAGEQGEQDIFDALPYYDNDLDVHPALRKKVEAELARENKLNPTTLHPKVPPAIEIFTVRIPGDSQKSYCL